ncbi:hypothetical protein BX666DRAFT_1966119 [Dichotomocladium elegans]|nr:hypothetical protein BX666DRAFT_1966119 [Dichotomocladium elegans]
MDHQQPSIHRGQGNSGQDNNSSSSCSNNNATAGPSIVSEDDVRRIHTLERNRAAAARCRQRKKQWVEGLQRKQEELSRENDRLYHTATQLQDTVFKLKSDILLHDGCNCRAIQEFIQHTLMKDVVQNQETEVPIHGMSQDDPTKPVI